MNASSDSPLLLILLSALFASAGYAGGRIHQWYRMGWERDEAYRDGYDTATRSVFSLAARVISPRRADRPPASGNLPATTAGSARNAPPAFLSAAASSGRISSATRSSATERDCEPGFAESSGRHTVPDELVRAPTYRLAADRVARAKVRGQGAPVASPTADGPPHPAVPKPRGSQDRG